MGLYWYLLYMTGYSLKSLERSVVCGINIKLDQAQLNCYDLGWLDAKIQRVFSIGEAWKECERGKINAIYDREISWSAVIGLVI